MKSRRKIQGKYLTKKVGCVYNTGDFIGQKAMIRTSSSRKVRTESSRQMRGARKTGGEYILELRAEQAF